ncbi:MULTISPECIES: CPBP family intramembrane glutamic endopeptidase [Enterobacteriaceae]|nr:MULTISPECIES: type II CAAX endopeptidase family protein [Enterobacteriaceae]ASQ56180.1 CPBP family intramembrane metalloprotease [Shigella flexneri 4c]MCB6865527.1 CPBP family intramembrane metalloprotease [Escherichia coli]
MIQTRNQYLQFMLVMLAAWGISWGARFVMEQAVLLYGSGKNYLFFSHGTVLMYLLCVFLVYRRWIAPLPVVGQLRNVGVPWLVGAMAVVYVGVFLLGKALALPAEPFMTKLFADKSIPDVILTLLTIFILAPLNEETLFRGIMLNVFRSRYCWTMWLGALITSLLFVAAHSQYQNLLTLAELFLVGLITSVARIRSGGLLLPVLLHMEGHCCKVSDEAAFCLIQRPYISKTLLTRRISPRGSP